MCRFYTSRYHFWAFALGTQHTNSLWKRTPRERDRERKNSRNAKRLCWIFGIHIAWVSVASGWHSCICICMRVNINVTTSSKQRIHTRKKNAKHTKIKPIECFIYALHTKNTTRCKLTFVYIYICLLASLTIYLYITSFYLSFPSSVYEYACKHTYIYLYVYVLQ